MRRSPERIREAPDNTLFERFLDDLRLRATFVVLGRLGPGTRVALPAEGVAAIHHVRRGRCSVRIGDTSYCLDDGDTLFMPRGIARTVTVGMASGVRLVDARLPHPSRERVVVFETGPALGRVDVLGVAGCTGPLAHALELLPTVAVVRASAGFDDHLDAMLRQASSQAAGARALTLRLAEVVFLHALRDVVGQQPTAAALAVAASDEHLSRVLAAMRREPGRSWTVPALADVAGLSRSVFAERFRRHLGAAPMTFLRQWRMDEARRRLQSGEQVQEVAHVLGYATAAAFSSAYKRVVGRAPSEERARSADAGDE